MTIGVEGIYLGWPSFPHCTTEGLWLPHDIWGSLRVRSPLHCPSAAPQGGGSVSDVGPGPWGRSPGTENRGSLLRWATGILGLVLPKFSPEPEGDSTALGVPCSRPGCEMPGHLCPPPTPLLPVLKLMSRPLSTCLEQRETPEAQRVTPALPSPKLRAPVWATQGPWREGWGGGRPLGVGIWARRARRAWGGGCEDPWASEFQFSESQQGNLRS